jgi:hypothetical protein
VVSSGRRNTLSQTQEMESTGDGSKICARVQHGGQRGVVEPAGAAHSQFNRVARQFNERWRETLGFETRAERDLMKVLHRPIEPTAQSGHSRAEDQCALSGVKRTLSTRATRRAGSRRTPPSCRYCGSSLASHMRDMRAFFLSVASNIAKLPELLGK